MVKQDTLQFSGRVIEILKNAQFRVKLDNGHIITAHTAGKIRKNRIRIFNSGACMKDLDIISKFSIILLYLNLPWYM